MGRMLDALRQPLKSESGTEEAPVKKEPMAPSPHLTTQYETEAVGEEETEKRMPFIEVGGEETLMSEDLRETSEPKERTEASLRLDPKAPEPKPHCIGAWMSVRFQPVPVARGSDHGASAYAPELIVFHDPDHTISQEYVELTSQLLLQLPDTKSKVLLFTSAARSTGTTTVLLNIALTLARSGNRRALVVDAHSRHSAIAQRLGLPGSPGMAEVLAHRIPLAHAIQQTGVSNLLALSAGIDPAQGYGSGLWLDQWKAILGELREREDLILIDAPHWTGRPEQIGLLSLSDAAYVCLREKMPEGEVQEMLSEMNDHNAPIRGCILTSR